MIFRYIMIVIANLWKFPIILGPNKNLVKNDK